MAPSPLNLSTEPGPSQFPVAQHRSRGYLQDIRDLVRVQPTKEPQLHDLAFARIKGGKIMESIIQSHKIYIRLQATGRLLL
jgi:hypothetical protein